MENPSPNIYNPASPGALNSRSTLSDINVTPLVDVFLVLLIIFMITAPMMQQGIEVNLPESSERPFQPEKEDRFIISISRDANIYLNDSKIPLEQLEAKLRQLNTSQPIRALYLKADESVSYGVVVRVMDRVKAAGIDNLGMVTKLETNKKGRP